MKVFAVLLGLVVLACSDKEDVTTLKDQVMTALTKELMQMDYNLDQASTIARIIVDDTKAWNYLMEQHSYLGSSFLSPLNVKEMLEEVLPSDGENILLYGNRTQNQNAKEDDDDDENDDDENNDD